MGKRRRQLLAKEVYTTNTTNLAYCGDHLQSYHAVQLEVLMLQHLNTGQSATRDKNGNIIKVSRLIMNKNAYQQDDDCAF